MLVALFVSLASCISNVDLEGAREEDVVTVDPISCRLTSNRHSGQMAGCELFAPTDYHIYYCNYYHHDVQLKLSVSYCVRLIKNCNKLKNIIKSSADFDTSDFDRNLILTDRLTNNKDDRQSLAFCLLSVAVWIGACTSIALCSSDNVQALGVKMWSIRIDRLGNCLKKFFSHGRI
ncbi:hypothetical protein T02_8600 [Trichinella nativa]|uniref:Uncharacterized protein n=1 Tax=Trichinella nativa TaxID=6335 RepID=A0A0V1LUG5_9BILA|nr:hypothetical protein T02_8600 [Trichinella nativa]